MYLGFSHTISEQSSRSVCTSNAYNPVFFLNRNEIKYYYCFVSHFREGGSDGAFNCSCDPKPRLLLCLCWILVLLHLCTLLQSEPHHFILILIPYRISSSSSFLKLDFKSIWATKYSVSIKSSFLFIAFYWFHFKQKQKTNNALDVGKLKGAGHSNTTRMKRFGENPIHTQWVFYNTHTSIKSLDTYKHRHTEI